MMKPAPEAILMPERPKADRDLDEAIALAAVREQVPDLHCGTARLLGSGWDTDVYLLDNSFAARFPRNVEMAHWLDAEEALLRFVASSLGSSFAVPTIVGRGIAGEHFPYGFLVCTLVPGISADHPVAPFSDGLAVDLGGALSRIHSVPVSAAYEIGLGQGEYDNYKGTLRFLHGDFGPANIIIDRDSGRLVGIIDWGSAMVGDPALDFVWLVLWRGWTFTRSVLAAYELPAGGEFIERVRFHAQIRSLEWLADTIKRGADPVLHLRWLQNAFSLGSPAA